MLARAGGGEGRKGADQVGVGCVELCAIVGVGWVGPAAAGEEAIVRKAENLTLESSGDFDFNMKNGLSSIVEVTTCEMEKAFSGRQQRYQIAYLPRQVS